MADPTTEPTETGDGAFELVEVDMAGAVAPGASAPDGPAVERRPVSRPADDPGAV